MAPPFFLLCSRPASGQCAQGSPSRGQHLSLPRIPCSPQPWTIAQSVVGLLSALSTAPAFPPAVPAPSFSRREQQPQRLRAARCFVLRSEQHAVDARRVFAVFAQPHPRRLSPPERHPVFCVEKKASRSTLVDVRSDAQIGIAIVLKNTDWVYLW
ncbi:hypothetical protein ZEAMMB73_Zm00001d004808 [Zea mays]|uniref:Uncharacterized protein n=1 Tax=Zea mays TaxID=4577 RepID=A0A1D6EHK7_MAIZE|nr:hypothetical protein ZEAMMB73_Zm00001d004808 [Zea mays]